MLPPKSILIIIALLILATYAAWKDYLINDRQQDSVNISNFPQKIGPWVSEDIPLSKADLDILGTKNVFIRKYRKPDGAVIYLYIVYSQNDRKVLHPPEICYTGSGITILENLTDRIVLNDHQDTFIDTRRLLLDNNNSRQVAFYWYKTGRVFTSNYWKQQMSTVLNNLSGTRSGSALIRVSVDIAHNDQEKAVKEGRGFIILIAPDLFRYLP